MLDIPVIKKYAKQLFIVLLIYAMGYYGFSSLYIMIPFTSWFFARKLKEEASSRQLIAKHLAENEEKTLSRIMKEDLPSWVYFPDVERVSWLNKIIHSLWPSVEGYVAKYLKDKIEPGLRTKIGNFSFTKINLGDVPLKIHGVKVYTNQASAKEIFMEMHISYMGDCDFEVSVKGIKAGIEDILFKGTVFILLKPLVHQIPFVGGVQVYFREKPEIQLNWTNNANLLDLPIIKETLLRVVHEYLAEFMVYPNKFVYKLITDVHDKIINCPEPKGVLRVKVIEAKQLMKKDFMTSDPYATITVGSQTFETPVIDSDLNPVWNYMCEEIFEEPIGKVYFSIQDFDKIGNRDLLGRTSLEVEQIQKEGKLDTWLKLDDATTGDIHVEVSWLALSSDLLKLQQYNQTSSKIENQSTCVLVLYVENANRLPNSEKVFEPSPYVTIKFGGITEKLKERSETNNPVWNKGFCFLVSDPEHQHVTINVTDKKTEKSLGNLQYFIKELLTKDKLQEYRPFHLKNSGPDSEIKLFMQLKIMDNSSDRTTNIDRDEPNLARTSVAPVALSAPEDNHNISDGTPSDEGGYTEEEAASNATAQTLPIGNEVPDNNDAVRRRNTGQTDDGRCSIHITLRYSLQRQALIIVVHKIRNVPASGASDIPDPYVKMYLRPGSPKENKRKTAVIKNNFNPEYDETFEYFLNPQELKNNVLEIFVCLWNSSIFKHGKVVGKAALELSTLDLSKSLTDWFDMDTVSYTNGGIAYFVRSSRRMRKSKGVNRHSTSLKKNHR